MAEAEAGADGFQAGRMDGCWLAGWLLVAGLVGPCCAVEWRRSYSADSRALDGVGSLSGVELARAVVSLAGATSSH